MKVVASNSFLESIKHLDSFKNKYYELRGWIRHIMRKDTLKVVKEAINGREWDSSYLYELEQAKINQLANYIEKNKFFEGWEYVVRDMRLCVKLIDIFLEKKQLFHYDGGIKYIPIEGSDDVEVDASGLKYVCDVTVNTNNIHRFSNIENTCNDWLLKHPHELYVLKAKYLYHKIRLNRDATWWE